MSLLRTSASRAISRSTMFNSVRTYAAGPGGSDTGATANASGFKDREQSQEKAYVQRQEQEKLKKLRDSLAKQRAHLDDLESAINDLGGQDGKGKQ
ncbi:unnamed protein product [Sympodiomycopsis kandeliae]